jgi:hypothetical protein
MNPHFMKSAAFAVALSLVTPAVAATSEPGRNGLPLVDPVLPPAATNASRTGATGNSVDAPRGIGPGFTKSEDVAPGVVARATPVCTVAPVAVGISPSSTTPVRGRLCRSTKT